MHLLFLYMLRLFATDLRLCCDLDFYCPKYDMSYIYSNQTGKSDKAQSKCSCNFFLLDLQICKSYNRNNIPAAMNQLTFIWSLTRTDAG